MLRGAKSGEVQGVLDEWIPTDENKVWLYELYENQAALEIHGKSPSLAEYRNNAEGLVKDTKIVTCLKLD